MKHHTAPTRRAGDSTVYALVMGDEKSRTTARAQLEKVDRTECEDKIEKARQLAERLGRTEVVAELKSLHEKQQEDRVAAISGAQRDKQEPGMEAFVVPA